MTGLFFLITLVGAVLLGQMDTAVAAPWDKDECAISPDNDRFTLGILPDTQYYSLHDPGTYIAQTQFLRAEASRRDIKSVLHLGDITHKNTPLEWLVARTAH